MTNDGWTFKVGSLVLFFTIFAYGNKDGMVNQRFIPSIEYFNKVLDWCTYALECLQAEIREFKPRSFMVRQNTSFGSKLSKKNCIFNLLLHNYFSSAASLFNCYFMKIYLLPHHSLFLTASLLLHHT